MYGGHIGTLDCPSVVSGEAVWMLPGSKTLGFKGVRVGTEKESREEGRGMGHEWDGS